MQVCSSFVTASAYLRIVNIVYLFILVRSCTAEQDKTNIFRREECRRSRRSLSLVNNTTAIWLTLHAGLEYKYLLYKIFKIAAFFFLLACGLLHNPLQCWKADIFKIQMNCFHFIRKISTTSKSNS
jgi:hypothetical protein